MPRTTQSRRAATKAESTTPRFVPTAREMSDEAALPVTDLVTPSKPAQVESAAADPDLEVVYDCVEYLEYSSTSEHGPITAQDMKALLDWKTEKQYQAEMMEKHPESKPEAWLFYDDFHCLNTDNEKVRCFNNANNRPFDMEWCKQLIHTILKAQWAGPLTMPGETINGEAIRVSKYGRVLSGQHQGTALILAQELLEKIRRAPHYDPNDPELDTFPFTVTHRGSTWSVSPFWNKREQVVIETLVITGLSEDPRILRTIDYVKPRSEADMLYTMELFRKNTPAERREMTRMLAAAIDLLWTRTDAKGYRTHPEIVGFLERHERLLKCVEHLFLENKPLALGGKKKNEGETDEQHAQRLALQVAQGGRRISKLHLSPGACAALMFLMGCSDTEEGDSDDYRNQSPPTEDDLDWSKWDRAKEFWTQLAGDDRMKPVRVALNRLVESSTDDEENEGLGGRADEKFALLAQAWSIFRDHEEEPFPYTINQETKQIECEDFVPPDGALSLCYTDKDDRGRDLPEGKIKLTNVADFRGIDCPESNKSAANAASAPTPAAPTPEQIEERARAERDRAEKEADAKKEESKKKSKERSIKRKG